MLNTLTERAKKRPVRTTVFTVGTLGVIAAVVFAAIILLRDDSEAAAQSANALEFQVQRGSITNSISVGGTSAYGDSTELTFESAGTIEEVMVEAGETVQVGDVIASLDASTVANLKVELADAEADLSEAQAVYDIAASGATSRAEIALAEQALAQAELAVTAAQDALLDVTASEGVAASEVEAAREDVDFAQRDLEVAQAELADVTGSETLSDAEADLAEAIDDYHEVLARWLGNVPDGFVDMSLDDILAEWDVTLSGIYISHAATHNNSDSPWVDNPETPWSDVVVWLWTSMSAAAIDPEATSDSPGSVLNPQVEINAVWDELEALKEVVELENEVSDSSLLAAEKGVQRAEEDLAAAQDALSSLLDPALVQVRQATLDHAVAEREEAEIALNKALANAESVMSVAQSRLELARQNFEDATAAYESSTIVSPAAGAVLAVNVEPGDSVNATTVVAEIADTSVITVEADVDEEDILSIEVGLPVSVSLDAVAGQSFNGTVTSIGQSEQSQQGAVSFPVTITLDGTVGMNLVEGLTASAQIINSQVTDVLMIPVASVGGTIFEPTVEMVSPHGTQTVPVQLGSSNGAFVEVVSGVSEGDTVTAVIAGDIGLPDTGTQPFFPGGGGFGGGFGGGGGGGRR